MEVRLGKQMHFQYFQLKTHFTLKQIFNFRTLFVVFIVNAILLCSAQDATDLGPCPCDLTGNACDVNCCCDNDCSQDDRMAFSFCLANSYTTSSNDKVCFLKNIILFQNSPYELNETVDGLFCIYFDNYAKRNFYINPDLVTAADTFQQYVDSYSGYSYQPDQLKTPNFTDYYKSGDSVYTLYENLAFGVLGLPAPLTNKRCSSYNPVAFLYDQSNECTRYDLTNLVDQCVTLLSLDATTYYTGFKVVGSQGLLATYSPPRNSTTDPAGNPAAQPTLVDPSTISDMYNNSVMIVVTPAQNHTCISEQGISTVCEMPLNPKPVFTNDTTVQETCQNTVKQVTYTLQHSGTVGITAVEVKFVFADIKQSHLPISQTFATVFVEAGEGDAVKRSGNPGYVMGEPVMVGNLASQQVSGSTVQVIQLNRTENRDYLTVVRPSVTSTCGVNGAERATVKFGEDIRSGCFISFSLTDMSNFCQAAQDKVLQALQESIPDVPYMASFGNSAVEKPGDWVPIMTQNPPSGTVASALGRCTDMVLGVHLQILYSNVGSLANPQPKIIGVSLIYERPQEISFECIGSYCQPGAETRDQKFEVIQSVSFIDVSKPAAEITAEPPIFLAKLPNDFFYPFFISSGSNRLLSSQSVATLGMYCIAVLCLRTFMQIT